MRAKGGELCDSSLVMADGDPVAGTDACDFRSNAKGASLLAILRFDFIVDGRRPGVIFAEEYSLGSAHFYPFKFFNHFASLWKLREGHPWGCASIGVINDCAQR
jgi:hypothetical protein